MDEGEKSFVYIFGARTANPTHGRQEENSKANGRRVVKELGKLVPVLRNKGRPREGAAVKRPRRLFSKNTGFCQIER